MMLRIAQLLYGSMTPQRLLALDFDGVLHPGLAGTLIYIDRIEQFLADHPLVGVVFSTTWREQHSVAEMASWFRHTSPSRFLGSTPVLGGGPAVRWREIRAWIEQHQFHGLWAALDDDESLFPPNCPELVRCDPARGVRPAQIQALISVLELTR